MKDVYIYIHIIYIYPLESEGFPSNPVAIVSYQDFFCPVTFYPEEPIPPSYTMEGHGLK